MCKAGKYRVFVIHFLVKYFEPKALKEKAYLTFGVGDFIQEILKGSDPILKFVGGKGLVVKEPIRGLDITCDIILFI